jgi:N-dimethylarginine dimethylaminohydrolase
MYIMVRQTDRVIMGSAINPISNEHASAQGYEVYEIDDSEFTVDMLGSVLNNFELVERE